MRSAVNRDKFEDALAGALQAFDGPSPVTAQVRHHVTRGVEADRRARLRMQLVVAVAAEEGGSTDAALDVACAVELLNESTIVHRDIEVERHVRDRRSTLWAEFGLAHGINAGDALNAIAYLHLLSDRRRDAALTVRMTRALQAASYDGTTAALVGAACELGALSAGAPAGRAVAYGALGRSCALAGQTERAVTSNVWAEADAIAAAAEIDREGRIRAMFA